jgi:PAS domain S-box-containing protein
MRTSIEGSKILIGEDFAILNNLLKDVFVEHGFEVVQAFDGLECKNVFLKENPDIAFIDINMPQVHGIDVLRFIKARAPDTIVVIMTGAGSEQTAVQAMKLGADEYLSKPFNTIDVVPLADKLLESRSARLENIRLKEEIRRGERKLAHLTRIINEALITTDAEGRIESVNLAATRMWDYSQEELLGKDVHFLVRGEAHTLLHRDLLQDTLNNGRVEGEFHFRRKDNSSFPGYLSTSVIRERDTVQGIVAVVADLTRLREVEDRLTQSEKLASLGKVVEGVAHEVRNCLTSLGGFAGRLRRMTSDDARCDKYTRIILEDVGRLETMVHQIEDYVKFSRFYSFEMEKIELPSVLEQSYARVLEQLSTHVRERVSYRLVIDEGLPKVTGDGPALVEVFYNLLLNAFESISDAGELVVHIGNLNSAVSVTIRDTGVGIREDDIPDVFNPFFTSKTTGAGMGLSKVYLLLEEHRGTIDIRSTLHQGTTVEVVLPVERLFAGARAWPAASRGGPLR